ncbi:MAG TPA: PHB depolymerase family esterase [Terracidiphilus sp.]|nr:PHB depolymerase family esterase [Terracidiphilus sp.]
MHRSIWYGIIIRALAVCAFSSIPLASLLAAETQHQHLSFGGLEREYIVSAPAPQRPRPTVLVLHGSLLNAQVTVQGMGFEPLVDRESLVAVYPNAVSGQWNDGRPMAAAWTGGRVDDVAFIRKLVGHLVATGVSDPTRVYVAGYSNGGMMGLRLICEAPELIAAVAGIGTTFPVELAKTCKAPRPTPMLVMNGTEDPLVPYDGGQLGFGGGRVLSTDATLSFLRKVNGCTEPAKLNRLPDINRNDGTNVVTSTWSNCSSAAPVVLYRIEGGGHRIPTRGAGVPFAEVLLGKLNHDFEAADAMWSFFKDKNR